MDKPYINFGQVKHTRLRPAQNRFSYDVFTLKIPMRERKHNRTLLEQFGIGDNRWAYFELEEDHDCDKTESSYRLEIQAFVKLGRTKLRQSWARNTIPERPF